MALVSGIKLGPYEIQSPLGAGGMGEVYRAMDGRLDHTVAIKVLASHLSSSPELKQRMEREARAISSLSHPQTVSEASAFSPMTTAGIMIGTIQYMSPEQIQGKEADARSDLFALGAVLYEIIT